MIANTLMHQITLGREGRNKGYSMGLPKLEGIIDGVTQGVYNLIFSPSGVGNKKYKEYCRLYEKSYRGLEGKNGEGCDANTVLNSEISQGFESV